MRPDSWSEPDPTPKPVSAPSSMRVAVTATSGNTDTDPITALPHSTARAHSTALPHSTVPAAAPRREITAALRQRRRQADPDLDTDLRSWLDQDPSRPRIAILGPVAVDAPGPAPDQRRRFHAEIITYLAQRGRPRRLR